MEPALGWRCWEQGVNLGGPAKIRIRTWPQRHRGQPLTASFSFLEITLTNPSRNTQCTPYSGFKNDVNLFTCKWGAALQLLAICHGSLCSCPQWLVFYGKAISHPRAPQSSTISLHELHRDGTARCCPAQSKGILLPGLGWLVGSFSSPLSNWKNWIYRIKTIGCIGTEIRRSHVCASDNPWIKNRV